MAVVTDRTSLVWKGPQCGNSYNFFIVGNFVIHRFTGKHHWQVATVSILDVKNLYCSDGIGPPLVLGVWQGLGNACSARGIACSARGLHRVSVWFLSQEEVQLCSHSDSPGCESLWYGYSLKYQGHYGCNISVLRQPACGFPCVSCNCTLIMWSKQVPML